MIEISMFNTTKMLGLSLASIKKAAKVVFQGENISTAMVNIVIVDDKEIHVLNKKYLNHDFSTDVITFSLDNEQIDGEIYISVETALSQASEYGVSLTNELMRLSAHGALHLAGYDDVTDDERQNMRLLEDKYIAKAK